MAVVIEELNQTFANNLVELRKMNKMTQLELADKLGYSDKNVSKWENGLAIPSADILVELSEYFGVTVDYLLTKHDERELKAVSLSAHKSIRNKLLITGLAMLCVWLVDLLIFMGLYATIDNSWVYILYGVPATAIVAIIFISLWFKKRPYLFIAISILVWSLVACIYLNVCIYVGFTSWHWMMFLVCVPLQLAVILWSQFKVKN